MSHSARTPSRRDPVLSRLSSANRKPIKSNTVAPITSSSCGCSCPLSELTFIKELRYCSDEITRQARRVAIFQQVNRNHLVPIFMNDFHPECNVWIEKRSSNDEVYHQMVAILDKKLRQMQEAVFQPHLALLVFCSLAADDAEMLAAALSMARPPWCVRSHLLHRAVNQLQIECVEVLMEKGGADASYDLLVNVLENIPPKQPPKNWQYRTGKLVKLLINGLSGSPIWGKFTMVYIPNLVEYGVDEAVEAIVEAASRYDQMMLGKMKLTNSASSSSTVLSEALRYSAKLCSLGDVDKANIVLQRVVQPLRQAGSVCLPDPLGWDPETYWPYCSDWFNFPKYLESEINDKLWLFRYSQILLDSRPSTPIHLGNLKLFEKEQFSNLKRQDLDFIVFAKVQESTPKTLQSSSRIEILKNLPFGLKQRNEAIEKLNLPICLSEYLRLT